MSSHLRAPAYLAGAALLGLALAANAYVSLSSIAVLSQGYENEERPANVQRTLVRLLSAVQDAETGQRGYLLNGDQLYLEPYTEGRALADSLLDELDALVSWNALQVERMPGLRNAVSTKFSELGETIRLYDEVSPEAALAVVRTDRGEVAMDDIRYRIDEMVDEAVRVHAVMGERADQALRRARQAAWASTGGLAALLLLLGLGVRAADRRREQHAATLASTNAALSTALGEREAAMGRVQSMQGQLVQQEKLAAMGRLTAGVAHEIKNPLNFVTNFAALTVELGEEATDANTRGDTAEVAELLAAMRQNAAKIRQHGDRANDIVQSMLIHARGVTGTRRPVGMDEVVDAAVTQALGPRGVGTVAVSIDIDPTLRPAEIVAEAVTRAIRNLVENALHAVVERTGAGDPAYVPAVRIEARPGTTYDGHAAAVVTVSDNGPGIPPDLFPRIFEPFFTTKSPGMGTGLGLSLAHDIAVGHGGSLLAERPAGGGTRFVLTLPLVAVDEAEAA